MRTLLLFTLTCAAAACGNGAPTFPSPKGTVRVPETTAGTGSSVGANAGTAAAVGGAGRVAVAQGAGGMSGAKAVPPGSEDDAGVPPLGDGGLTDRTDESGAAKCPALAYVSNSGADSVSVIDTHTNKVVTTISVGTAPVNPTFTPDHKQVYVSNSQGGTLSVIDVATQRATRIPAGGPLPSGLAFTPDGKLLLVTLLGESVITPGSLAIHTLGTGEIAPLIALGAQPERIALTPDGARAYIVNLGGGSMSVVDIVQRKVTETIMLGELPFNPLMSPDGKQLYVGIMFANSVAVIDPATNQILRSIAVDTPNGIAFSLDYQSLFITNAFTSTLQQISLAANEVTKSQEVGGLPGYIALVPDSKLAYFVRPDGTTVEVVDTTTLRIVESITVESGPSVVTICRDKPAP